MQSHVLIRSRHVTFAHLVNTHTIVVESGNYKYMDSIDCEPKVHTVHRHDILKVPLLPCEYLKKKFF